MIRWDTDRIRIRLKADSDIGVTDPGPDPTSTIVVFSSYSSITIAENNCLSKICLFENLNIMDRNMDNLGI